MDLFKFTGAYENVSVSFKWDPYCMAGLFVNDLRVVASLRLKQLQNITDGVAFTHCNCAALSCCISWL